MKKTTILSVIASTVILISGCGGGGGSSSSDNNIVDTTPPQFTTPNSFTVPENQTTVATIKTNESNVTFSISGGVDGTLFKIGKHSGKLSFLVAPNYESPSDSGSNNIYSLTIEAKDSAGNKADQNITITVTDVDENDSTEDTTPPTITSNSSFNIAENQTQIATLNANESVTFSIVGGDDQDKFNLSSNGVLSFKNAPDYENPDDSNQDGVYNITIRATDSAGNTTDQAITITVTDVNENTTATKVILKTGDDQDGAYGADRSATRNSDETVTFVSLSNTLWSDTTASSGVDTGGTERTFSEAKTYCDNLTIGGKTDWRLPTRYELFQTIDYGDVDLNNSDAKANNLTDDVFDNYNSKFFWTSDEYNSTHHIAISFSGGLDYIRADSNSTDSFVRCISAPVTPSGVFTRSDDNKTVTDSTTNLMWQDDFSDQTTLLNHTQAQAYCQGSSLSGHTDWRVPTINELHTIADYANNKLAFETAATDAGLKYFWSFTRGKDDPSGKQFYRYQSIDGGVYDGTLAEDINLSVRCVRTP